MYENIGSKIKGLAKVIFIVEAILAVITGFFLIFSYEEMIFIGFLVIIVGPTIAWISSWLLYGFGQLIENSDIMSERDKQINEKRQKDLLKSYERKQTQRLKETRAMISNPNINENEYIDIICPNCKEEISFTKGQLQKDDLFCPMCDNHISL